MTRAATIELIRRIVELRRHHVPRVVVAKQLGISPDTVRKYERWEPHPDYIAWMEDREARIAALTTEVTQQMARLARQDAAAGVGGAREPRCRHCRQRAGTRGSGLCWLCFPKLEIRTLYRAEKLAHA